MIFVLFLNQIDEWKVFDLFFESNRYFSNEMTQKMLIQIFVFCLFVHSGKWKGFWQLSRQTGCYSFFFWQVSALNAINVPLAKIQKGRIIVELTNSLISQRVFL